MNPISFPSVPGPWLCWTSCKSSWMGQGPWDSWGRRKQKGFRGTSHPGERPACCDGVRNGKTCRTLGQVMLGLSAGSGILWPLKP